MNKLNKFLEIFERCFAVVGIIFFSGMLLFGFGEGDDPTQSPDLIPPIVISLIRYFIWVTSVFLLGLRWKNAFVTAKSDLAFWLLTIIVMMSPFWSDYPQLTLSASREVLQMTCFGWYLASRFSLREQMKLMGLTFAVGAIASALVALAVPGIGIHTHWSFPGAWRGIFIHKNELGGRMVIAAMVCTLLIMERTHRRLAWLGLIGAWILIFLSESKTALALGIFMPGLIYLMRNFRWRGKSTIIALDFVVLFIAGIFGAIVTNWVVLAASIGKTPDISGRFPMWGSVLSSVQERPWFGFGRGGFWAPDSPYAIKAGMAVSNNYVPPHGHNGFVDMLADVGWIGFALFTISLMIALLRAFKLAHKTRETSYIWSFTFLVLLIANNMTESIFLNLVNIYWTFYIATALSLRDAEQFVRAKSRQTASPPELVGEHT